jgi:hypothetical protein
VDSETHELVNPPLAIRKIKKPKSFNLFAVTLVALLVKVYNYGIWSGRIEVESPYRLNK